MRTKGSIHPTGFKVHLAVKALFAVKHPYLRYFSIMFVMNFVFLNAYKIVVAVAFLLFHVSELFLV
ncbi:hypothetical protein DR864_09100 [Runella rosea]|uniref:Uncharacterized protein n=1 Tax=Runella rosea TaxID=2259595 RepID=A0A344TGV5_9BACT|nr:hypothetical protein DR864_09100 [Runella rosea]